VSESDSLDQACQQLGIISRYRDHTGAIREVPKTTLSLLVRCLQAAASDPLLPPVFVHRQGNGTIAVPFRPQGKAVGWAVQTEQVKLSGLIAPQVDRIVIDQPLPLGYHQLRIYSDDALLAACTLVVAPAEAFLPPILRDGGRLWGLATQLFTLRSPRNWGIGDFTDLEDLVQRAAVHGAAAIGLTPLHALFPDEPDRCSPYSPNSRCFLNVLFIDPEATQEFAACEAAQALRMDPAFSTALDRLRSSALVDYAGVADCKRRMFEVLYQHFRDRHLARNDDYAAGFREFQKQSGKRLRQFATFEALHAHFATAGASRSWRTWPDPFRDPESAAVADFVVRNEERIVYFEYLQWHAYRQLIRCQQQAHTAGMPIGIYLDIAVGVDNESAEAWWSQDYLVGGWSIGAPPDNWNLKGQSWGAPPPNVLRMRETAYAAIRECLEANMRPAGAVRIDHILGFMRLFWVPEAADAAAGAYIRYPLDDLLAILALESQEHRCLVIGEDLGTVPEGLREALQRAGILTYRLLYFEHEPDGSFRKPKDWPRQALVAPSTHDLSTLPAYWRGADLELRSRLDLYPSREVAESERRRRAMDRNRLIAALASEGLPAALDENAPVESIYRFLARTPSHLLMVQPEDLLGLGDPMNVPGTTLQSFSAI
jgi:4-alpha-glucanotransferase